MAQSRKHKRKHRSSKKRFNVAKGLNAFIRSPIPPSPIPPPPNPLESRPTRRKKRWPRHVSFVENLKK